jgi:F0F1-type ATP synthase alpha subunit
MPLERIALANISRTCDVPLQTGIKAIDAMTPIVVTTCVDNGDRQTGKTAIVID